MTEQELENGLALLLEDMAQEGTDGHEIFLKLTNLLNGMRALGMPLPEDLVRLQAEMAEEFAAEQGAGRAKP